MTSLLLALAFASPDPVPQAQAPDTALVVTAARLIDVQRGTTLRNAAVVVLEGRIIARGSNAEDFAALVQLGLTPLDGFAPAL
jgi:hypothetical protein